MSHSAITGESQPKDLMQPGRPNSKQGINNRASPISRRQSHLYMDVDKSDKSNEVCDEMTDLLDRTDSNISHFTRHELEDRFREWSQHSSMCDSLRSPGSRCHNLLKCKAESANNIDPFVHLPVYHLILYKKCGYAVLPVHGESHLAGSKHRLLTEQRREIMARVYRIEDAIRIEKDLLERFI